MHWTQIVLSGSARFALSVLRRLQDPRILARVELLFLIPTRTAARCHMAASTFAARRITQSTVYRCCGKHIDTFARLGVCPFQIVATAVWMGGTEFDIF